MARAEVTPRSDAGLLLGLLRDKLPHWASLPDAELQAALVRLADATTGDRSAVETVMDSLSRLKAMEIAEEQAAARFEAYHRELVQARTNGAHYVSGVRHGLELERRQAEAREQLSRSQGNLVGAVAKFLTAWPPSALEPGWPTLAEEWHPANIAATALQRIERDATAAAKNRAALAEASRAQQAKEELDA